MAEDGSQKVITVIDDCIDVKISINYQCGHPFGFVNSIYMGETAYCKILSSNNSLISESNSTNNKWTAVKRFQDGTFILNCPAYGFTKDENGELIIQEEEAAVVRRIFMDYLNGKGTYVIIYSGFRAKNEQKLRRKKLDFCPFFWGVS